MARQILCFDSWMFAECPVTIDYICTFYFFFYYYYSMFLNVLN